MELRLDDGTTITGLSRPPQGSRHRIVFGVEESSGREVAAKIELLPGTLEPERRALEWLDAHEGPAPRLRAVGRVASTDDRGALCLICDRAAGEHPRSLPGWERLGAALAGLSALPWRDSGLDILDHRAFLAVHEGRVDDLGTALGSDLGPRLPALTPSYSTSPLVLTHGDPGPGNFLDDGAAGTLIDWEDAYVAPRGLDLGRAAFIALLGAGPEGYAAADHAARSGAVVAGFRAASADWSTAADESTWWLSVAGIQFAHRRLERAGEPGVLPWRDALDVLAGIVEVPPS
jgi:aminoglycoside phosphotransferase (APT) family kinase protein